MKYEAKNVTGFLDGLIAKAYYHDSRVDRWQNRFYYREDATTKREVDDRQLVENLTTGVSIQSTSLIKDWQRLTYGIEFYVDDAVRDHENFERLYDEKGTTLTKKSYESRAGFMDSIFSTASLFIQSEVDILDGLLTITPGVRFDRFAFKNAHFDIDKSDQRFLGGVSVIYRMTDKLYWVGGVQQGYVHPGLNLVKEGPRTGAYMLPNPDLKPEDAIQYEVGFRANYGKVSGFVTYYNNDVKNKRALKRTGEEYQGLPVERSVNIGKSRHQGIEVGAEYNFYKNLLARANYAWQTARDLIEDKPLRSRQPTANLSLRWHKRRKYWAEFVARALFASDTAWLDRKTGEFFHAPGYVIYDLRAGVNFYRDYGLRLAIENLANRDYPVQPGSLSINPGRNFVVRMDVGF